LLSSGIGAGVLLDESDGIDKGASASGSPGWIAAVSLPVLRIQLWTRLHNDSLQHSASRRACVSPGHPIASLAGQAAGAPPVAA
jgi:hypothetical protein